MKAKKMSLKILLCVVGAALALEFAGCHGGSGGTTSTEPNAGAAGSDTNSAATNAPAATNASSSADTSAPSASQ